MPHSDDHLRHILISHRHFVMHSRSVFTARRYACAVYAVVVCLFVRLSVTRRYSIKTAKLGITQTTPYDSPRILLFWGQRSRRHPQRGRQI